MKYKTKRLKYKKKKISSSKTKRIKKYILIIKQDEEKVINQLILKGEKHDMLNI